MITFKKIISVFLCIVITLSVCSVDFGIVSQAIEKTAGMAELSAFEGENAEITKSKNSEQFAELVGELGEENWEDNYFSEIVVDKNNVVNVDGDQTQLKICFSITANAISLTLLISVCPRKTLWMNGL